MSEQLRHILHRSFSGFITLFLIALLENCHHGTNIYEKTIIDSTFSMKEKDNGEKVRILTGLTYRNSYFKIKVNRFTKQINSLKIYKKMDGFDLFSKKEKSNSKKLKNIDSIEIANRLFSPDFERNEPLFIGLVDNFLLLQDGMDVGKRIMIVYDLLKNKVVGKTMYATQSYPKTNLIKFDWKNYTVTFYKPQDKKPSNTLLPQPSDQIRQIMTNDPSYIGFACKTTLDLLTMEETSTDQYIYVPLF